MEVHAVTLCACQPVALHLAVDLHTHENNPDTTLFVLQMLCYVSVVAHQKLMSSHGSQPVTSAKIITILPLRNICILCVTVENSVADRHAASPICCLNQHFVIRQSTSTQTAQKKFVPALALTNVPAATACETPGRQAGAYASC